jgi:hypothetical protein
VAVNRERWDVDALRAGAMVSLVFAVPFAVAARWAADSRDDSTLALWLSVGALVGFTLGAGCAAWVQRLDLPLSHALVCAIGTYAAAQVVFIAIKLARGGEVGWFGVLFTLSAVAGAGLVGGVIGRRLRAKGFRPTGMERT